MTDVGVKITKPRLRIPVSCINCRKKKVKCDKAKPHCGPCVKKGTVDLCKYNEKPWASVSSKIQLSNEVIKLKMKLNKMEKVMAAHNLTLDDGFEELPSSAPENDSPNLDPVLELGERFDNLIIKENKLMHWGSTSVVGLMHRDKVVAQMFAKYSQTHRDRFEIYLKTTSKIYKPGEQVRTNLEDERKAAYADADFCLERETDSLAMMPNLKTGNNGTVEEFLDLLSSRLPSMAFINALVDHFFRKVYLLVPFLNEELFRQDLNIVLFTGPNDRPQLRVVHMCNLSTVPLLLIVLRFSYLSLKRITSEVQTKSTADVRLAKLIRSGHTIGAEYIEYAKHCVHITPNSDNVMRKVSLKNIQVLLYLRLYRYYSPEDVDESPDGTMMMAVLVQMARMQGLFRDPSNFGDVMQDERVRVVWRRIFYKLLFLDAVQALSFGCPLNFSDDEWDTMLPELNKEDQLMFDSYSSQEHVTHSNKFRAVVMENQVNKDTALEWEVTKLIRKCMKVSLALRRPPKRSQIVALVDELFNFLEKRLPSFLDMFEGRGMAPAPGRFSREINTNLVAWQSRFTLNSLAFVMSYLLFISAEDRDDDDDVCEEYLIKTMETSLVPFKMVLAFLDYMSTDELTCSDSDRYDKHVQLYSGLEYLLASGMLIAAQKSLVFFFSLHLRAQNNMDMRFDELSSKFSNRPDTLSVLYWLNTGVIAEGEEEETKDRFNILVFHHIKRLYHMSLAVKETFLHCWRISMMIKIFLVHMKSVHPQGYEAINRRYDIIKEKTADDIIADVLTTDDMMSMVDNGDFQFTTSDPIRDAVVDADGDEFYRQLFVEAEMFQRASTGFAGVDLFDNWVQSTSVEDVISKMNSFNTPSFQQYSVPDSLTTGSTESSVSAAPTTSGTSADAATTDKPEELFIQTPDFNTF